MRPSGRPSARRPSPGTSRCTGWSTPGRGSVHAPGWWAVGCCWALMLVMFAVGIANLTWMAPLALLMALEKTSPSGLRLVRPAGFALLALGALAIAHPAWLPRVLG